MGQRIIGLTGGIATGKSTVAHYLANHHGLPILDADVYARQAVAPGSPILDAIAQRYGPDILNKDSTLNRGQLGQIIFREVAEKDWLESQIHPYVRQQFAREMRRHAQQSTVVQVIPLLFEAGLTDQVTETWVVTCASETQLSRLMYRNGLSQEAAQSRINSQWPLAKKVPLATVVLDNDGDLTGLYQQVDQALQTAS